MLNMNRDMKKGSKMTSSSINPFRMPRNISEFARREDEEKRQERRRQRTLEVHKKGLKPRESIRKIVARYFKEIEEEEKEMLEDISHNAAADECSPEARDKYEFDIYHLGTTREFIEMEREIHQLKTVIAVGQEKLESLKKQTSLNKEEIARAEYELSDEAFEDYVKEEVKKTVLVIKMAEENRKAMLETKDEFQRISKEVEKVKKEINNYKLQLKHSKMCKEFLWKLSPPEWQKQQEARKQIAEKIKAASKDNKPTTQADLGQNTRFGTVLPPIKQNSHTNFSKESCKRKKKPREDEEIVGNLEVYEKPQLYFTDPNQLLRIMADMEEETNCLFEELDSFEKSKEGYNQNAKQVEKEMADETTHLSEEIDCLTKSIMKNKQKVAELQEKIKVFNEGEHGIPRQNAVLQQLHKKLEDVYTACIGRPVDNRSSDHMLGDLEVHMYELLEKFESVPQEILKPIMSDFRREKIARMKKEEYEQKEKAKEEVRQRRAATMQKRAFAEVKKPVGKKVMWRSWVEKKVPRAVEKKAILDAEEKELERYLLEGYHCTTRTGSRSSRKRH